MRRLTVLSAAISVPLAVAAPIVLAGHPARLSGRFSVQATITANNFKGVKKGTKSKDVYTFTATCKAGACAAVKLVRAGGTSKKHYRSTLKRTPAGTYTGTEGPIAYPCPTASGEGAATFTAKHTIKVTKSSKTGKATAFTGTSKYAIHNCSVGTFVNYTLKGKLGST
jgi:hypothetical protein